MYVICYRKKICLLGNRLVSGYQLRQLLKQEYKRDVIIVYLCVHPTWSVSQNHKMASTGRDFRDHGAPTPCCGQGYRLLEVRLICRIVRNGTLMWNKQNKTQVCIDALWVDPETLALKVRPKLLIWFSRLLFSYPVHSTTLLQLHPLGIDLPLSCTLVTNLRSSFFCWLQSHSKLELTPSDHVLHWTLDFIGFQTILKADAK